MSTRSNISIKLKEGDIGKTLRVDLQKLRKDPSNIDNFGDVELNGNYATVYSHFDGYPEGVGRVLFDNFNNYDSALNLILGGSMSCPGIGDDWKPYALRDGEEWEHLTPKITNEEPEALNDYLYLFNMGRWWIKCYNGTIWSDLEEVLNGNEPDPFEREETS